MLRFAFVAVLLVGFAHSQNELTDDLQAITKHLGDFGKIPGFPGLEGFNQSALPSLEDVVQAVKNKCEKNGGSVAYVELETAKDELQEYIQGNFDFEQMQKELDEKRKTGSMEEVFAKYCTKAQILQKSHMRNLTTALENCLDPEEKINMKIFLNVSESLFDFMCYRDGDRIALFVAEGGFDCIESKRDELEKCLNDTLYHRIPKDLSLSNLPTFTIDESACNDYAKLQACSVNVLEKCKDTTPANIVDAIFKFVRRVTPCKDHPIPGSVLGTHRRVTRQGSNQFGPLYVAYDQVKQKYEPHCEKNGGQKALVEFRDTMTRVEMCLQSKVITFRQHIEPMRGFPFDYFCTTLRRDIRACLANITDKIEACSSKAETYVPKFGLELYDSVYNFYCKEDAKSLKNYLNKQDSCINKAQNSTSYCMGKTKHVKAYATDAVVTKSELCSDLKIIRGCYKDVAIQTCPSNKVANEFVHGLSEAIYAPCAASSLAAATGLMMMLVACRLVAELF